MKDIQKPVWFEMEYFTSLFQALRQWGRRESERHVKSWRGGKKEKGKDSRPLLSPVSSRFYFCVHHAFSIQRTRLSRSLGQASTSLTIVLTSPQCKHHAQFLIIGTERQLSKVSVDKIKIGQAEVSPASSVRNLGTWFDSHLDMSTHVTKTCAGAFYYLYNIRHIRKHHKQA